MYIRLPDPALNLGQPPQLPAVPRLSGKETKPASLTLYVEIDLQIGNGVEPCTGIFCPDHYQPLSKIDLLVYLHGHNDKAQCFDHRGAVPIDQYWTSPNFLLREEINASGKNVILVAPSLGQRSEAGELEMKRPGGFDRFLDQVMAALIAYGPYQRARHSPDLLGNVILACHSGGGSPMLKIASSSDKSVANIQEYWGFDCLYSGFEDKERTRRRFTQPEKWKQLAKSKNARPLFIYYKSSTEDESIYLKRLKPPMVQVKESEAPRHCLVPITHLSKRLAAAAFLRNT